MHHCKNSSCPARPTRARTLAKRSTARARALQDPRGVVNLARCPNPNYLFWKWWLCLISNMRCNLELGIVRRTQSWWWTLVLVLADQEHSTTRLLRLELLSYQGLIEQLPTVFFKGDIMPLFLRLATACSAGAAVEPTFARAPTSNWLSHLHLRWH